MSAPAPPPSPHPRATTASSAPAPAPAPAPTAAPALALIPIDSPADPRLRFYANLKDADLARATDSVTGAGRFIAEGELVLLRLIDVSTRPRVSPNAPAAPRFAVESVLLAHNRAAALSPDLAHALARLPGSTPIYVAPQHVLDSVTGFNVHRGVLAVGLRGPEPTVDALLAAARPRALVVCEDLTNLDNAGGIFRAAAALAGTWNGDTTSPAGVAVVLSERSCDPLYRKSVRVSMGHVLAVPFARLAPWPAALQTLRWAGYTLIALTPAPDAVDLDDLASDPARRPLRPALLLGSEGPGLSQAAMDAADLRVRIAIAPGVDSLNVTTAAAIALHRLCRPEPP